MMKKSTILFIAIFLAILPYFAYAQLVLYKNGISKVSNAWTQNCIMVEAKTNTPFDGNEHLQMQYNIKEYYAGFGLGFNKNLDFSGYTHLRIATRGLNQGQYFVVNLRNINKIFSGESMKIYPSTNYQVTDIDLAQLGATNPNFNIKDVIEIVGTISGVNVSNGSLYIDAIELVNKNAKFPTGLPACLEDDYVELEKLYKATNGDNWKNKNNWLTNPDMAQWHGVWLTPDKCDVLAVHIGGNNLAGELPMLNLPNLEGFSVSDNQMRGTIPIFNAPKLRELFLHNNQFTGGIPNFNYPNLEIFWAYYNHLQGTIPVLNTLKLKELLLYSNQFSGALPNFGYPNLEKIWVSFNQLTGSIPDFNMPKLKDFRARGCHFLGNLPNFSNTSLTKTDANLWLSGNKFVFGDIEGKPWLIVNDLRYAEQQNLPLYQENNKISVRTGSSDAMQTFEWYKDGQLVASNQSSSFQPTMSGKYACRVTHKTLTIPTNESKKLVLQSNILDVKIDTPNPNPIPPNPNPVKSLEPFTGTFGTKELIHLLRRTMFGVTKEDLKHFSGKSLQQTVNELMLTLPEPMPPVRTYADFNDAKQLLTLSSTTLIDNKVDRPVKFGDVWTGTRDTEDNASGHRRESFRSWWLGRMVTQDRNITEKMTLFWMNFFSVDGNIVIPVTLYDHNKLLRKHALGNFKTILQDVTLDPAMLMSLSGNRSTKSAPNENYARELQELYTVGKEKASQYTEDDVKAAARLLTGWNVPFYQGVYAPYTTTFSANNHDVGDKQFSAFYGNKTIKGASTEIGARNEINELLNMILSTDEAAKHVVRRLYIFFLHADHLTPEVETNVIAPLAKIFRESNYDVRVLIRALLTSQHFYKEDYQGAMIKSPVDFIVTHLRQSGSDFSINDSNYESRYNIMKWLNYQLSDMRQALASPPDVAGWDGYLYPYYSSWVSTSSYLQRKKFYDQYSVMNMVIAPEYSVLPITKSTQLIANYAQFVKNFDTPSDPNKLIDQAVELCLGVSVSQEVKNKLKTQFLLQGQGQDYYWTQAYNKYISNPNAATTGINVPENLRKLFLSLFSSSEYHLH